MGDLWQQIARVVASRQNCMLSGLFGVGKAYVIREIICTLRRSMLVVVPEEEQSYDLAGILAGMLPEGKVKVLPAQDLLPTVGLNSNSLRRAVVLGQLAKGSGEHEVLVASAAALQLKVPPCEAVRTGTTRLVVEQEINPETLMRGLIKNGYERVKVVESPGQVAWRGGIIDIYPVNEKEPVRLELMGQKIESLRRYSPETQRSTAFLQEIEILPLGGDKGLTSTVWDYLGEDGITWLDEVGRLKTIWEKQEARTKKLVKELARDDNNLSFDVVAGWQEFQDFYRRSPVIFHSFFPVGHIEEPIAYNQHVAQKECEPFWAMPGSLKKAIKDWLEKGYKIFLALPGKEWQKKIKEEIGELSGDSGLRFVPWKVEKGFVSSSLKTAVVGTRDLVGRSVAKGAKERKEKIKSRASNDLGLSYGDYVVHETHGIGIFQGMTRIVTDGVSKEYLILQYAGGDILYLPAEKVGMITKYVGGDSERRPRLSRLGSGDWEKTKRQVKESVKELAEELLSLYAARERMTGFAFSPDSLWQKEFEEGFEFEETPDQAKAIQDVKKDMEKPRPMDRLICGDVGYGKTEVALRAAFKAVMDHKQVAVLVPTTVLAEQHYQTFGQRFKPYPVVIEVLSRFRKPGQINKVLKDLERGVIDIVIGTHRLLSKDVKFRDLGLLIVDEEHRFGVRQKERLKTIKRNVDVISLSATPIPRTLYMALSGLRDLSVIETPPPERYPINTYVLEYNPEIIREAVIYEVQRGGQVFFLHNRIEDIERVKKEVEELVPGLKVGMAHGRMEEEELAEVMRGFMAKEIDVLVCTTIIESGLDLPNVNTLIVDNADKLGLAQLYQIRGRIGRSNRVAYAYLMYRPDRVLTENAQKRLNAIREFTDLGSGLKIAMEDLKIRGAGNILGPQQHGHIEAVGFDLYVRLLEEEAARLRGERVQEKEPLKLEVMVDSYIPDEYIDVPGLKVQFYRQIMLARSEEELEEIKQEMEDRFGPVPRPADNLLRLAALRLKAQGKKIKYINSGAKEIEVAFEEPLGKKAKGLLELKEKYGFGISVSSQDAVVLKNVKDISLDVLEDLVRAI